MDPEIQFLETLIFIANLLWVVIPGILIGFLIKTTNKNKDELDEEKDDDHRRDN